jgi:hypothetical protein
MQNLTPDALQVGMVVALDVKDEAGQLLIPSGVTLVEKHLDALKSWGIKSVTIEDKPEEEVQISPEMLAKAEGELTPHFRHTDRSNPFTGELFRICVERKARKYAG